MYSASYVREDAHEALGWPAQRWLAGEPMLPMHHVSRIRDQSWSYRYDIIIGQLTGDFASNRPQILCNVGLGAFGTAQAYLEACLTCSPERPHSHAQRTSKYTADYLCWSTEEGCCTIGLRTPTTGRWNEAGAARPVGMDAQRHPAAQAHHFGQRPPLATRPASSIANSLRRALCPKAFAV